MRSTVITGEPVAAGSAAKLSVTAFDARLVHAPRTLTTSRAHVQRTAREAGLNPPRYFGTEVVARFLGLRTNHPFADDALELYPWEPITRAEAAHSLQTLLDGWRLGGASTPASSCSRFSLPRYGASTKRALRVAVSKIGMPYIWGGETDRKSSYLRLPGARRLRLLRLRVARLQALRPRRGRAHRRPHRRADGGRDPQVPAACHMDDDPPRRPGLLRPRELQRARRTEAGVDHVGIALSEHWMIHAVGAGRVRVLARRGLAPRALHLGATRALRTFDLFTVRQQTLCSLTQAAAPGGAAGER